MHTTAVGPAEAALLSNISVAHTNVVQAPLGSVVQAIGQVTALHANG